MSKKVAVIGAGVGGCVSISELKKQGHQVKCFEIGSNIGGLWSQANPNSAMYDNLRTNLTRKTMTFDDFEFSTNFKGTTSDNRDFPGH